MEIIQIYESGSTDGYSDTGDGLFFLDKDLATQSGKNKYGNYSCTPLNHIGVEVGEGEYLLLKSPISICLANSEAEILKIKTAALNKLTDEEKEILGLRED